MTDQSMKIISQILNSLIRKLLYNKELGVAQMPWEKVLLLKNLSMKSQLWGNTRTNKMIKYIQGQKNLLDFLGTPHQRLLGSGSLFLL